MKSLKRAHLTAYWTLIPSFSQVWAGISYLLGFLAEEAGASRPFLQGLGWHLTILPVDESHKENCREPGQGWSPGAHRGLPGPGGEQVTSWQSGFQGGLEQRKGDSSGVQVWTLASLSWRSGLPPLTSYMPEQVI